MPNAPYITFGTGSSLLFAFHGYGMDGAQFQVLDNSLCEDYQIIGFHLPYHKGGPVTHRGWLEAVVVTVKHIMDEKGKGHCAIAGYSIGSKIVLALLPHFKEQIRDVYLFAPYGLTKHWGISFLESALGIGFFRLVANTSMPLRIINGVHRLGVIGKADHEILNKELVSREKRENLRKTFLLMRELDINRKEVLARLNVNPGMVRLVFGKYDAIFSLQSLKERDRPGKLQILEVMEGHWLMTSKLDELLTNGVKHNHADKHANKERDTSVFLNSFRNLS